MSEPVYLITGASRGIGAAVAREFAAPGRVIGINYLSSKKSAEKVLSQVRAKGADGVLFQADVTSASAVDKMFEKLERGHGRLDIFISNAGVPFHYGRLADATAKDFENQWRTQVLGAFFCCRRAVALMAKNKKGKIIFVVSSVVQNNPPAFMPAYVSAKYGLLGFARALKEEVRSKGIEVDCVFPPMTDTDFIRDFPRPIVDAAREDAPGGRLETPENVARSIRALVERAEKKS